MTGQGGALFDYDNDGDLDVYLVQGAMLGDKPLAAASFPPPEPIPRDRLLRNDLRPGADGRPQLRFTDVTEASGLNMTGYGMGVATGDFDNDGWVDLYVTQYGSNRLLRNQGDGRFIDVTDRSGTADSGWSTSAAFFDYDRDGWLDLYVVHYVDYLVSDPKTCFARSSQPDYCGPSGFVPQHDRLFHNLGNGRFEEVSDRLLRDYRPGPGLGVVSADFNGDGWADIYVANDGAANQLWINQQGRVFSDESLFAGTAFNRAGKAEASMGVDAGDFDNDGDQDLFMTHLMGESNTLYLNDGKALFEDLTARFGLATGSFPFTSFGTGWIDYDNDGWLDLLVLNGAVQLQPEAMAAGDPYPLRQPNQLFHNEAGSRFREHEYEPDSPLRQQQVSRGAAFGDLDNDGDLDVLVFNNNGPVQLLRNEVGQSHHWIGLRLTDAAGRRDQLGALVDVETADGSRRQRRAHSDASYCSANDPRVLVGLADQAGAVTLRVTWPDGTRQEIRDLQPDRYHHIRQPVAQP